MAPERMVEIIASAAFQCHKTIDYAQFEDPRKRQGDHPQQCAGLMAMLRDEGMPNAIMVAGMIHGALDMGALDPDGTAYNSFREAFEAHTGEAPPEAALREAMENRFDTLGEICRSEEN